MKNPVQLIVGIIVALVLLPIMGLLWLLGDRHPSFFYPLSDEAFQRLAQAVRNGKTFVINGHSVSLPITTVTEAGAKQYIFFTTPDHWIFDAWQWKNGEGQLSVSEQHYRIPIINFACFRNLELTECRTEDNSWKLI